MAKKRGRPRIFNKMAFLKDMQAGLSRDQVCKKLKISYSALEYHLGQDKYFRGKIYAAERKAREEKRKPERTDIYMTHHRIKQRVPVLEIPDEITWINSMTLEEIKKVSTTRYSEEESIDFDEYLKDLARMNPRKWGPAVRRIREWYKWHPEMQRFFAGVFMADPIAFRWILRGPPSLSEVNAYIAKKEIEFEECKQVKEFFEKQLDSLTMAQRGEWNRELEKRIYAALERELNEYSRSISKNF